jgi:hypothetical protein
VIDPLGRIPPDWLVSREAQKDAPAVEIELPLTQEFKHEVKWLVESG